jgi:putative PEP-CTERM system histidine kinase
MRSTLRRGVSRAPRDVAGSTAAVPSAADVHVPRPRARYDYRRQWMTFTRRLSRTPSPAEVARGLVEHLAQAVGATSIAVYLDDGHVYRRAAQIGDACFVPVIEHGGAVPARLEAATSPVQLPAELLPSVSPSALPAALIVTLPWRAGLLGFLVLGPRPSQAAYGAEDADFLATAAGQAAASIVAARQVEATALPRAARVGDRSTTAVIHDIKNAVSALSMLARNAAASFADPQFQRDAITTLSRTVERMRGSLAKLSAPEATTPPSPTEPIDLQELIIEATSPLAADHKVRLVRQLQPVNPVYGDRDALLRVVENLATNASEAIDHEGTVTVTLAEDQGHAIISVADTGCGMSEDYRTRHLFTPFQSTKKDGWGIGLYHTKQMVERQDGEILVESVVGHGTTFTVKLPLRADVENASVESVR